MQVKTVIGVLKAIFNELPEGIEGEKTEMYKTKIFISHSTKDKEVVEAFVKLLRLGMYVSRNNEWKYMYIGTQELMDRF